MNTFDYFSNLGALGYQEGAVDLLAIIRNEPKESMPPYNLTNDLSEYNIISANSFDLNPKQTPQIDTRYAGEGAESNTFLIPNISIKSTINLPLQSSLLGLVDPSFALLWDYCKLAYWGTAGIAKAKIIFDTDVIPVGQTVLTISNISDFFQEFSEVKIVREDGLSETINVSVVDKSSRSLILSSPTQLEHTIDSEIIGYLLRNTSIEREPAFSLLSFREGLLYPCLVNKISIDFSASDPISIAVEIFALNMDREKQIDLVSGNILNNLFNKFVKTNRVSQIIHGSLVKIGPSSFNSGTFGLERTLGDNFLSGFQSLDLPLNLITGINITIDNNLKEIYTLHSLKTDLTKKRRENSFPFALVSGGRTITGNIKYRHPINQFAFAERLSGPSALANGGLIVKFDTFKITIPEIVWSPSTSTSKVEDFQNRTLNWSIVAQHFNEMPILEWEPEV
jgi:hypothetical protein